MGGRDHPEAQRLQGLASRDRVLPLSAERRFVVVRRDIESLETAPDFALLRRMAAAGGGEFLPVAKLGELLDAVRAQSQPRIMTVTTRTELSDALRWWVLLGALAALCAEWIVRKRRGLA